MRRAGSQEFEGELQKSWLIHLVTGDAGFVEDKSKCATAPHPREQHRVNWASACYFRSHVSRLPSGATALSCAVLWRAAAIEEGMLSPFHGNFDVGRHLCGAPVHPSSRSSPSGTFLNPTLQSDFHPEPSKFFFFFLPCCGTSIWSHEWFHMSFLVVDR